MLRIILNRKDIVVKTINSQKVEISPLLGKKAGILGNSIPKMKAFYLFQKLWKGMTDYDEYEQCNIL